ncbi:MAG: 50S ribosomal protein L28 [Eubacteriaceae bacterium]|nr:50S ribosomal protein L28 [Eubacteriaceae bacterium]
MPYRCYVCDKRTVAGNNISHSNIHTKRVFKPNLRRVKINENGTIKTVKVCAHCLRAGRVTRA